MTQPEHEDVARLRRRFERERAARKEAESVAEEQTRALYLANQQLKQMTDHLEQLVGLRTAELEQSNLLLKQEIAERELAVMERTRLYEETQRTLQRTEALYRASRSLSAVDDIDALLQVVVDSAVGALNTDRVQLFGIDLEQELVSYTVRGGPGRDLTRDLSFAELMNGLSGWSIRTMEPAVSEKAIEDPRESETVRAIRRATQAGAVLVVPVRQRDRVLGTITAVNRPDQPNFVQDDIELLSALANQAAVAIANAQLFQEMRAARAEAESANQAKSRFLANMSHELRTPLNGILGYAQILRLDQELAPKVRNAVGIIESSGHHLLTLINDILDLSKIEADRMELVLAEFYFPEFLETIAGIVRVRAEQKNVRFVFEQLSNIPVAVEGDEQRLRQVLLNILGNAVKFTNQGEVIFSVGYHYGRVRFQIKDSGVGIPQDELTEIFKPFRQTSSRPVQVEGTGLGLAISDRLIQMMGSKIHVSSQIGQGSTFWFDLDLKEVSPNKQMQATPAARLYGYTGQRRTILVADDRETNRTILTDLLGPLGFETIEATNGKDAVILTQQFRPDLVLMDLVMPEMDGFAATRAICDQMGDAAPPVIAVSASVFDVTREQCQAAGCRDYVAKPVDISLLLHVMGEELHLEWLKSGVVIESQPEIEESTGPVHLSPSVVSALHEAVLIGDVLAVDRVLDVLEQEEPDAAAFVRTMRSLAEQFQLDEMQSLLEQHMKD